MRYNIIYSLNLISSFASAIFVTIRFLIKFGSVVAQEHRHTNLRTSFQRIPRAGPFSANLRFRSVDLDNDCRSKSSIVVQNSECYKERFNKVKKDRCIFSVQVAPSSPRGYDPYFKFSTTGRQGVNEKCLQRLSV